MVFMFFFNNFISKPTLEQYISKYRYIRLVGKYEHKKIRHTNKYIGIYI